MTAYGQPTTRAFDSRPARICQSDRSGRSHKGDVMFIALPGVTFIVALAVSSVAVCTHSVHQWMTAANQRGATDRGIGASFRVFYGNSLPQFLSIVRRSKCVVLAIQRRDQDDHRRLGYLAQTRHGKRRASAHTPGLV